jgi:hypothetical protein
MFSTVFWQIFVGVLEKFRLSFRAENGGGLFLRNVGEFVALHGATSKRTVLLTSRVGFPLQVKNVFRHIYIYIMYRKHYYFRLRCMQKHENRHNLFD